MLKLNKTKKKTDDNVVVAHFNVRSRKRTLSICVIILSVAILGAAYYFYARNKSNTSNATVPALTREQAVDDIIKKIEKSEKNATYYKDLYTYKIAAGDKNASMQVFEQYVEKFPKAVEWRDYYTAGLTYAELGNIERARMNLSKAQETAPKSDSPELGYFKADLDEKIAKIKQEYKL